MPFTYAIADLHGRYDLLSEAVTKILEHSKSDRPATIITLGDYVDRGPKSRQRVQKNFAERVVEIRVKLAPDTPVEVWFQMLWGRAELILRQPESSDGAAPCNRSTPLILPSTWLLSSVHQSGSSPPASLGPRSHICIGSRAVIRPPCSLSSRRCAPCCSPA